MKPFARINLSSVAFAEEEALAEEEVFAKEEALAEEEVLAKGDALRRGILVSSIARDERD